MGAALKVRLLQVWFFKPVELQTQHHFKTRVANSRQKKRKATNTYPRYTFANGFSGFTSSTFSRSTTTEPAGEPLGLRTHFLGV